MTDRGLRVPLALVALAALALIPATGCLDMLNPSLVSGFGFSPTTALEPPKGTILILLMNTSDTVAVATVDVYKENGGQVVLKMVARPFSLVSERDHQAVIQDCDVSSIQLRTVTIGPDPNNIAGTLSPLVMGRNLYCGNVVAIWIVQSGAAYFANLGVF